jgi:hypothetical protein
MANWISGAIKRPGRMKRAAKRAGISVHQEEERAAKSGNKSLAAAGRLGLRLSAMSRKRTVAHGSK